MKNFLIMTGNKCCITGCLNTWGSLSSSSKALSFHSFPKNPVVRQEWISFCNKPDTWIPTNYSRIFSEHFYEDDCEITGEDQPKSRVKLLKNFIPAKKSRLDENHFSQNTENVLEEISQGGASETCVSEFSKLKEDFKKIQQEFQEQKEMMEKLKECNTFLGNELSIIKHDRILIQYARTIFQRKTFIGKFILDLFDHDTSPNRYTTFKLN